MNEEEEYQGNEEEASEEREPSETPTSLTDELRSEPLKVTLEASQFSAMEDICAQIAIDNRMPESVKANLIAFISTSTSDSVALSYYNTEEDRKRIIGLISLNEQLLWHTGYKIDKNRKNNFYVGMGRYGAEVQTRKGRGAHGSRLLAMTIVRQEQGIAPGEREMRSGKRGWFDWIVGR